MGKSRKYTDSGALYRVHIDHLYADESGVYQTATYGPYATEGSAKGQATERLSIARHGGRKAVARVEWTPATWKELAQ